MNFLFNTNSETNWSINANFGIRQLSKKGLLTYEYNPLKVLRYSEDYNNGEETIYKNELTGLDTEKLNFDLLHPVLIEALESYDGTVNLILNDDKNIPRMINTRFSCTGYNTYQIVERTVDSNIYDYDNFEIQTSLYKRTSTIPKIKFIGLRENGNLKVGNYTFYFKLADGDGNETDWIGQSNIVSCHLGSINDPFSIRGGMEDENSYKQVEFKLTNLDTAYNYITVYFVRTTSSLDQSPLTTVYKVGKLYNIVNGTATVLVSGFETAELSSVEDLNALYIVVDAVKTQTLCDNMLFFGNVKETEINYEELTDLSLRITPELTHMCIGHINQEYKEDSGLDPTTNRRWEYYNANNIYNFLGYWDDEFYRFGVVYILNNYTLSPVFNIRGISELNCNTKFNQIPVYKELNYTELEHPTRNKIIRDKEKYTISYKYRDGESLINYNYLSPNENSKGVIKINYNDKDNPQLGEKTNAIGFNFNIPEDVLFALDGKVKGMFIVRQKRNPTTVCQTVPILTDKSSHLPALPVVDDEYLVETMVSKNVHYLTHDFNLRRRYIPNYRAEANYQAAICPDYTLDLGYFNNYFTGAEFILKESKYRLTNDYFLQLNNYLYTIDYENREDFTKLQNTKMYVTSIPDSAYQVKGRLRKNWFAAAAGEEADPFKVTYVGYPYTMNPDDLDKKNIFGKVTKKGTYGNTDYVTRGFYGPYIGLENKSGRLETQLYDIKIPNYEEDLESLQNYIDIRCRSSFPFYAISPRFSLEDIKNAHTEEIENILGEVIITKYGEPTYKINNVFGGDCYIGNFTTRMNRNFSNPEAPNNNIIVDGTLWGKNYHNNEMATGDHNKNIIAGDVFAVQMGHFATVKVCSNFNLAFRSTDPYTLTEVGVTGHKRSFYPYTSLSSLGSYKIPESFLINSGLNKTLDERYNLECPDIPAIKNDFSTRILYSDIAVQNSFINGYRVFRDLHYQDYTTAHGDLTSLIEKSGDIFCIFEHAAGYLTVQATQLQADAKNSTVFLTTANVLPPTPQLLNSEFGSQWLESVIKTPTCIYGFDTVAKRIWRIALETSGLKTQYRLKTISDFKVQRFLNENVTVGEYETEPTIGIRNVKTHYNAFKGDIMFTFYDDVNTIEEKVWNLCFNEALERFITFYSWVPSYSENINNVFFTFDRDTSKYIAKLFADPSLIKLEGNSSRILSTESIQDGFIGNITFSGLSDYPMWEKQSDYIKIKYEVVDAPDSSLFYIKEGTNALFVKLDILNNLNLSKLYKLPIKITIEIDYNAAESRNVGKVSRSLYTTFAFMTKSYYENLENTSFWKHGLAGLMETKDDILPTKWYGKRHPFEFEFIVAENLLVQKIFNTLLLTANKAKPESFHFEVVGESYTFADDKKNIFWRLEALKHIYQWNNGDITYNRKYELLDPVQRREWYRDYYDKSTIFPLYYYKADTLNEIYDSYLHMTSLSLDYQNMIGTEVVYDKLLGEFKLNVHTPARCLDLGEVVEIDENTYNELYHTSNIPVRVTLYPVKDSQGNIVHDDEGNIVYRTAYEKYVNYGRRIGNCHYKEDEWYIQIPPILYAEKNENWPKDVWNNENGFKYPPLNVYYTPIQEALPEDKATLIKLPTHFNNKYYYLDNSGNYHGGLWWQFEKWLEKQTRLRDKFVRIKVRYSGEDLAIIYAIKTSYTISYS